MGLVCRMRMRMRAIGLGWMGWWEMEMGRIKIVKKNRVWLEGMGVGNLNRYEREMWWY